MKAKDKNKRQEKIDIKPEIQPEGRQEKLSFFLRKVQDKVVDLLDAQTLKLAPEKTPFTLPQKQESKDLTKRLRQIQDSKTKMQSRLRQVAQQQRELKSQQKQYGGVNQSRQRSTSPLVVKVKSELSEKDISLLKRLKHEQRKFQRSLEQKTKQFQQKVKESKKEEDELREKHKKQETQARKKQIAQRLEQIQKQRAERQKKYEQEKKKMIELKAKKKLFEEADKKMKQTQKTDMQSRVAAMEERFKQRQVDLQAIRQHQQKYREIKAQQQAERQKRKEELDELARQKRLNVEKSKYYTIVLSENRKKKEQREEKEKERFHLVQAARDYAQNVKRQHAPRVKTKQSQEQKQKDKQKFEGLTLQQRKQVGNSYMEYVYRLPKKKKEKMTEPDSIRNTPKPQRTLSTKYRDYLSERRQISDRMPKMNKTRDSRIRDRTMWKQVDQACKMADSNKQKEEGLERLKYIANRLQSNKGTQDPNMLDKITAKLKILQTLTNR